MCANRFGLACAFVIGLCSTIKEVVEQLPSSAMQAQEYLNVLRKLNKIDRVRTDKVFRVRYIATELSRD